jgi:flagellar hook-associated protein 1 FlgK
LVANTTYSFSKTSWISNVNTTISGYAATLTAMDAGVASQAEQNLEKQQSLFQAFYEKFREGSGVDLDYELATTSIYQNSYAAAANILSTANRLFEVLMQAIR